MSAKPTTFLVLLLLYVPNASADWRKICLNAFGFLSRIETHTILDSNVQNLSATNHAEVGEKWAKQLREQFAKRGDKIAERFLAIPQSVLVKDFLDHAFQNAVQHGIGTIEQQYSGSVRVTTQASLVGNTLVLQVSNPPIKPFPKSLQKRFYKGSSISIPSSEREGYQGSGVALFGMAQDLSKLPKNSYVEWDLKAGQVNFTLSIDLSPNPGEANPHLGEAKKPR
jgi:hypothetical protein